MAPSTPTHVISLVLILLSLLVLAPAKEIHIRAGDPIEGYTPEFTKASVGDVLVFEFWPLNHSVVRGWFKYPCMPYELQKEGNVGFSSGFFHVEEPPMKSDDAQKWSVRVNDTKPIFYYCSADGGCNMGMVGVINPTADQTLADYRLRARAAKYTLQQGDSWPKEEPRYASTATSAVGSPTSAAGSPTPTKSADNSARPSSSPSVSEVITPGVIAGVSLGGLTVVLVAGLLFMWLRRQPPASKTAPTVISVPIDDKSHIPMYAPAIRTPSYYPAPVSPPPNFHDATLGSYAGYGMPVQNQQMGQWLGNQSQSPVQMHEMLVESVIGDQEQLSEQASPVTEHYMPAEQQQPRQQGQGPQGQAGQRGL